MIFPKSSKILMRIRKLHPTLAFLSNLLVYVGVTLAVYLLLPPATSPLVIAVVATLILMLWELGQHLLSKSPRGDRKDI